MLQGYGPKKAGSDTSTLPGGECPHPDKNLIPTTKGDPEQSSVFLRQLVREAHEREKAALARVAELEHEIWLRDNRQSMALGLAVQALNRIATWGESHGITNPEMERVARAALVDIT